MNEGVSLVVYIYFYGLMAFAPQMTSNEVQEIHALIPDAYFSYSEAIAEQHVPEVAWVSGESLQRHRLLGESLKFQWVDRRLKPVAASERFIAYEYPGAESCNPLDPHDWELPCSRAHSEDWRWLAPVSSIIEGAKPCRDFFRRVPTDCSHIARVHLREGTFKTCKLVNSLYTPSNAPHTSPPTRPIRRVLFPSQESSQREPLHRAVAEAMVLRMAMPLSLNGQLMTEGLALIVEPFDFVGPEKILAVIHKDDFAECDEGLCAEVIVRTPTLAHSLQATSDLRPSSNQVELPAERPLAAHHAGYLYSLIKEPNIQQTTGNDAGMGGSHPPIPRILTTHQDSYAPQALQPDCSTRLFAAMGTDPTGALPTDQSVPEVDRSDPPDHLSICPMLRFK